MKNYQIICDIELAEGHQEFSVQANSPEEALALFHQGKAEFVDEEVTVKCINQDNPTVILVQES